MWLFCGCDCVMARANVHLASWSWLQEVHRALREVHARLAGFRKSFEYIQDYINTCVVPPWFRSWTTT